MTRNDSEIRVIEGYPFPSHLLYYINDLNGGMWASLLPQPNVCRLGFTSVVASKLGRITSVDWSETDSLKMQEIFLKLKTDMYQLVVFGPLVGHIVERNPLWTKSEVQLTVENTYTTHWLLDVQLVGDTPTTDSGWLNGVEDERLSRYVRGIVRSEKLLASGCCPDLRRHSTVTRRRSR